MYRKKIVDGYFEKTVTYSERLKYCPYGSCGVEKIDDTIFLISYTTTVCGVTTDEDGNRWIWCNGTYSNTTRKHIGAFSKEFTPTASYYDYKRCYENDMTLCIDTGECRPIG